MSKELREKAYCQFCNEDALDCECCTDGIDWYIKLSDAEQILASKLEEKDAEIQSLKSRVEKLEDCLNYVRDHLPDEGLSLSDKISEALNPQT